MAIFGLECSGAIERKFWVLKGVYSTQVGFAGGYTSNPTYKEVYSDVQNNSMFISLFKSF
uniref:peptide-methionine (S)-S-oxide reductase n=1 Tax=Aotus nancymaae TaxID=37293 RepID=A0A2K5C0D1_AOTNA